MLRFMGSQRVGHDSVTDLIHVCAFHNRPSSNSKAAISDVISCIV